jgi:flagellar assembly protein FliH
VTKNVFRAAEVILGGERIYIDAPETSFRGGADIPEALDDIEEYTGPTADDLRREAELFRAGWEEEKEHMLTSARLEAEKIVQDARLDAEEHLSGKKTDAQTLLTEAQEEAARLTAEAQAAAEEIVKTAKDSAAAVEEKARTEGFTKGREEGWQEGRAEAQRIIERLHLVLSKVIEKRSDIMKESEAQIIKLIILIARKVVKVISENQKSIVINNTIEALQKLKTKADISIRVNLEDTALMTEHIKDIIERVENVKNISILEDSTVGKGGCIVETDFGEIDARIASQLQEIEDRILELSPVKSL